MVELGLEYGKNNWREQLPGFWLPISWGYDEQRWPDYTSPDYERALTDTPDIASVIVFRGYGRPTPAQWGAWLGALAKDKHLPPQTEWLAMVADRMYDTARYKYLVPAWRRALVAAVTELDNIEDQLSTILWVAEIVTKKWIPIPPGLIDGARRITNTFDCAGKVIAGVTPFRGAKSQYGECLAEIGRADKKRREQKAGLIAWFQANWGRLLEAAQATGTWFDVGIVLGPLYAYVDEGLWGLTQATATNYLIATDALFPGYAQWARETDEAIHDAVQSAWDETWGNADLRDGSTIEEDWAGFTAP